MSTHLHRLGFGVALASLLAALTVACSGDDDDDDDSFSTTKTCCLNGAFYECSNSERMCTVAGHTCDRMPSRDDECS